MICPKCGRPVAETAVICRGCDFILDTSFLGTDILDEEHQLRPGLGGVDPAAFNLADAVILGNIGDDSSSFETSDSGFHLKLDQQAARLYVSGRSQAVMSPDAVIAIIDATEKVRLTPFEKHVLRFIDGARPVETIRKQAGLDEAEVKTALATLADKGVVKVVGRALADAGDFDVETAPGNTARRAPRRVRGTFVGAVVVGSDAADQAIDDAFRTQVRVEAPKLDPVPMADDGEGVFSGSGDAVSVLSADIESFERPTDEVVARRPPSGAQIRPTNHRPAVNAARRTGRFAAAEFSEPSDGFDDFGDASNLATAVVQQPSLSEDSLPAADPQRRPPSGVFTNDRRASLSEDDEFDTPGVGDLADSRVAPRPHIPGLDAAVPAGVAPSLPPQLGPLAAPVARPAPPPASPWVAPPTRPPTAAPPALPSGSDGGAPLNDVELAAMTGAVWSDNGNVKVNPGLLPDWRAAVTASPTQRPARRGERSTSLSELLDSSDDGPAAETGAAPALPAAVDDLSAEPTLSAVPIPGPANPRAGGNGDEPTAFRPPPMPMPPVPLVARRPEAAPSAPDDDFDPGATLAVESPLRLAPAPSPAAPPPAPAIPAAAAPAPAAPIGPPAPRTAPAGNDAQADADLFDGDGGGEGTDGAIPMLSETRDLSVSHAGAMRYPPPPQPQPLPLPASLPASLAKAPATLDYTAPPSQDAASGDSDDDADADDDSDDDSAEQLDSEMVVRPAARASPPSAASPAPAPRPPASPAPAYGSPDDDDFMVDPDATMNLPARPKSMEGRHRREVEAAPPPPVVAEEPAARGRRPPTEDMRRKARLLFEQALKDHASGKLGAARMNVKLATIYDPTVAEYAQLLEHWEDKPRAPTAQPAASNRPEYVELYERAQELEDDGDIDGALEALERGLPLAPNAAAFHNRIGVILAMRRREFDRAAAEIERAIALEPENAHYRSNLGKVMARANRRRDVGASAR